MLYHYTGFAAFDGIIRCGELRLNNILNMNDAAEMRLFMNGIQKAVLEKLKKDGDTEKIRGKWPKNFTTPLTPHVFPSTGMTLPNGNGTAV